ncbi:hypothetical protein HanLR1_Chr00c2533g0846731 [Helianthus annuus]|nr:hypothetical protein HanLR1_Chr00c2533g0846731 [Helianthus annuus]
MSESDDEERPKMERWRPKVAASKNKPPADMPKPSSADPPRLPAYMPKPPADEPKPPKPKPPKLSAPSTGCVPKWSNEQVYGEGQCLFIAKNIFFTANFFNPLTSVGLEPKTFPFPT